jgi:hypothetical protein
MESLKLSELKKLAKEAGIPKFSTMRKQELLDHLSHVTCQKESFLKRYLPPMKYSTFEEVTPSLIDIEDALPEINRQGYLVFGIKPQIYSEYYPEMESSNSIRGAYFVEEKNWKDVLPHINQHLVSRLYTPRSLLSISREFVKNTFDQKILQKSRAIPSRLIK